MPSSVGTSREAKLKASRVSGSRRAEPNSSPSRRASTRTAISAMGKPRHEAISVAGTAGKPDGKYGRRWRKTPAENRLRRTNGASGPAVLVRTGSHGWHQSTALPSSAFTAGERPLSRPASSINAARMAAATPPGRLVVCRHGEHRGPDPRSSRGRRPAGRQLTAAAPGMSTTRSGSARRSSTDGRAAGPAAEEGRDEASHVTQVGDRHLDRKAVLAEDPARVRRLHLGPRVHDDEAEGWRNRQVEHLERIVAADRFDAAEKAWRHVVGMDGSRRHLLPGERVCQQRFFWERAPDQLVDGQRAGDAACRRAAEAACQGHLLVHPEPDAGRRRRPAGRQVREHG